MVKTRLTIAAVLGELALSAVAASSASAGWFIEEELPAGFKAALASTAKVAETSIVVTGPAKARLLAAERLLAPGCWPA